MELAGAFTDGALIVQLVEQAVQIKRLPIYQASTSRKNNLLS